MSGGKLKSDQFYALKSLKWRKRYLTIYMDELFPKSKVCFKEESLPIIYQNFLHKSLVRPKSKIDKNLNP